MFMVLPHSMTSQQVLINMLTKYASVAFQLQRLGLAPASEGLSATSSSDSLIKGSLMGYNGDASSATLSFKSQAVYSGARGEGRGATSADARRVHMWWAKHFGKRPSAVEIDCSRMHSREARRGDHAKTKRSQMRVRPKAERTQEMMSSSSSEMMTMSRDDDV